METDFEKTAAHIAALLRVAPGGEFQIRSHLPSANPDPPRPDPRATELQVTRHCYRLLHGGDVDVSPDGDPPDCKVTHQADSWGVEVGSLVDRTTIEAWKNQEAFLHALNRHAELLPPSVEVRLVMWDDPPPKAVTPTESMREFGSVTKWAAGFFVDRVQGSSRFTLNQHRPDRGAKGIFPRGKEVETFAREVSAAVRTLAPSQLHARTYVGDPDLGAGGATAVPEVLKKLHDHYSTSSGRRWDLLLHNYWPLSDLALELWHPYWHYRDEILSAIATLAAWRKHPFRAVLFVDYSHIIGGCTVSRLWHEPGGGVTVLAESRDLKDLERDED